GMLRSAGRVPWVMPLPTAFRFQMVEPAEVASRLWQSVDEGPRGRLRDFGGPEVLTLGAAATPWREARGVRKPVVHVPVPGKMAAAFRAGKNTTSSGDGGKVTWREWLARQRGWSRAGE